MTRLRWFGHATVRLELDDVQFLFDPFLVGGIGPVRRRRKSPDLEVAPVDAVLVSHAHQDHLHLGSLRQLDRSTTLVVPRNTGRLVRAQGFEDVHEVDAGDELTIGSVRVRTVPAAHDGRRMPFGPAAPAVGYVLDGNERVYFAGDTDLFPEMADLAGDLDLAILPIGGWGPTLRSGHLNPTTAAAALRLLRPRTAVAVHWGTLWPVGMGRVRRHRFHESGDRFIEEAQATAPEVMIPVLAPGDSFEVPPRPA
ncbi:MAG TPA: MBL fold metallo-hydrolase [Candidatus Limnocylindrales bacterium]|nr:MBL fold metallo-hydrolase [Candidatus Limnocylindrales bacterium]